MEENCEAALDRKVEILKCFKFDFDLSFELSQSNVTLSVFHDDTYYCTTEKD